MLFRSMALASPPSGIFPASDSPPPQSVHHRHRHVVRPQHVRRARKETSIVVHVAGPGPSAERTAHGPPNSVRLALLIEILRRRGKGGRAASGASQAGFRNAHPAGLYPRGPLERFSLGAAALRGSGEAPPGRRHPRTGAGPARFERIREGDVRWGVERAAESERDRAAREVRGGCPCRSHGR
jgi:hypothetical protein